MQGCGSESGYFGPDPNPDMFVRLRVYYEHQNWAFLFIFIDHCYKKKNISNIWKFLSLNTNRKSGDLFRLDPDPFFVTVLSRSGQSRPGPVFLFSGGSDPVNSNLGTFTVNLDSDPDSANLDPDSVNLDWDPHSCCVPNRIPVEW